MARIFLHYLESDNKSFYKKNNVIVNNKLTRDKVPQSSHYYCRTIGSKIIIYGSNPIYPLNSAFEIYIINEN